MATECRIQSKIFSRVLGCIQAALIGDSLGSRYEFMSQEKCRAQIRKDIKREVGRIPMLGGGPFNLSPGQVTDDSELSLCIMKALVQNNLQYVADDVARYFAQWKASNPLDIGNATANAIGNATTADEMITNAKTYNENSCSNGALMRTYPVVIACYLRCCIERGIGSASKVNRLDDPILEWIDLDASITHSNSLPRNVCRLNAILLFQLFEGITDPAQLRDHLLHAVQDEQSWLKDTVNASYHKTPLSLTNGVKMEQYDTSHIGFIGCAFYLTLTEIFHGTEFVESLQRVISYGGDTDTNGTIAAAALGARFGAERVPDGWWNCVKEFAAAPSQNTSAYFFRSYTTISTFVQRVQEVLDTIHQQNINSQSLKP